MNRRCPRDHLPQRDGGLGAQYLTFTPLQLVFKYNIGIQRFVVHAMVRFNELSPESFIDLETPALKTSNSNLAQTVLHIVKSSPDGIAAGQIAEALDVSPPTVLKTLRALQGEREVYSRSM